MLAPLIGAATNLKCVTSTTGTALSYTAHKIVVGAALGGLTFKLSNFAQNISALDTGALAANSFCAAYAYVKNDGTMGGFLQLEPAAGAPAVYGGVHMPANMVASALIGLWPTNASAQFIVASQIGRRLSFALTTLVNGTPAVAFMSVSAAALILKSARTVKGGLSITLAGTGIVTNTLYDRSAPGGRALLLPARTLRILAAIVRIFPICRF